MDSRNDNKPMPSSVSGLDASEDVETLMQRQRDRDPNWYAKKITAWPKTAFGVTMGGHVFLTFLNLILLAAGYDILPVVFLDFPLYLKSETVAQREHAWMKRDTEDPNHINRVTLDAVGPTWDRGYPMDQLVLYYSSARKHDINVFQKKYFQQMNEMENSVYNSSSYRTKFCQLYSPLPTSCIKPISILRYFDGTFRHLDPVFNDPDFENIPRVLHTANTLPQTRTTFQYFLGKGYRITPEESYSNVTRTAFPLGLSTADGYREALDEYLQTEVKPGLDEYRRNPVDGLQMNYFGYYLFEYDSVRQAIYDMMLAIGSLAFIFSFIWLQTRSLWITGWAVLSVVTSFWITNLIYRIVLDYRYFGYFHIVAIFVIIGIGADDIFVFYNTWKGSELHAYKSLAHRLSDCYRTAAGNMFFTSFTTFMAFLVGVLSPLLPLSSFGVFSAVLVGVNYISVIVFFPTVIIMHHLYFEDRCCPSCADIGHGSGKDSSDSSVSDVRDLDPGTCAEEASTAGKPSRIVVFFRDYYFFFITHEVIRWVITFFFLGIIGFFVYSATNLEPDSEEVKMFRKGVNYGKAMRLRGTAFIPSGDQFVVVYLVWGMHAQDFSSCHKTDFTCPGQRRWDDVFDLNNPLAQTSLQKFCSKLKQELSSEQIRDLMIRRNSLTGRLEVDCFLDNLGEFLAVEESNSNDTVKLGLPLTQTNTVSFMKQRPNIYDVEGLDPTFFRYFEISLSYWMANRYSLTSTADFLTYNSLIGEDTDDNNTKPVRPFDMFEMSVYGTRLRYAAIRVNLSLSTQELNYIKGFPVMDKWEDFMNSETKEMPPQLRSGFQVTEVTWHWLSIQQKLVYNALLGIVVGITIALPVLILATKNWITGVLATLIIACVTVSVLGVLPLIGWKLDVMVSMNLAILVGLSVDYVVHLAEGYHASLHTDRRSRVRDMLEELGISVLWGALTTMGSAFFMLFAKLQFFLQFGTCLFCTIGFSLLYSLVFFSTLLALFGPENEIGSILPILKFLKRKFIGRSESDVDCRHCHGHGFVPLDGVTQSMADEKVSLTFDKMVEAKGLNEGFESDSMKMENQINDSDIKNDLPDPIEPRF